jgi:hypothetical protein
MTFLRWLLDTHPWIVTVALFWTLFAIAEAAYRITGAIQAWHRDRLFKRETTREQRFHAEAARRRQQLHAVTSFQDWRR